MPHFRVWFSSCFRGWLQNLALGSIETFITDRTAPIKLGQTQKRFFYRVLYGERASLARSPYKILYKLQFSNWWRFAILLVDDWKFVHLLILFCSFHWRVVWSNFSRASIPAVIVKVYWVRLHTFGGVVQEVQLFWRWDDEVYTCMLMLMLMIMITRNTIFANSRSEGKATTILFL